MPVCDVAVTWKSSEVQNSTKNTIHFLKTKRMPGPVLGAEDKVMSNKAWSCPRGVYSLLGAG